MGGVFLNQPFYVRCSCSLEREWPARVAGAGSRQPGAAILAADALKILPHEDEPSDEVALHRAVTEQRNPRSAILTACPQRPGLALHSRGTPVQERS
jgi:hypothetical protein